jgi:hypothetical protein
MKKSVITLSVIALIIIATFAARFYVRNRQTSPPTKSPQVLAMESTGLVEFSPGLVEVEIISPTDRTKYEKLSSILSTMGDGKDPVKNAQAIGPLNSFINKYPDNSEAYFMRATLALSSPSPDYAQILKDIDKTEQLNSSATSKNPTVTTDLPPVFGPVIS